MAELPTIPLQFGDLGNALASGAHARYYTNKARQEQNAFEGEQAARPDIPAAIGGDAAAQGRVAQASPITFAHIAPHIAKLDADKRAQVKGAAEYTTQAASAILQANPADRPAIYQQLLEQGKALGYPMGALPPTYSPALEPQLRSHRAMGISVLEQFKADEAMRRHNTHGGGTAGGEILEGAPPAAAPGPRADAGPMPGAPPVSVAQAQAPAQPAASPAAPMMAQAAPPQAMPAAEPQVVQGDSPGPTPQPVTGAQVATPPGTQPAPAPAAPPGFEPMGHRSPDGKLVPAMLNGKPVFRNPQTGELMQPDAAPAAPSIAQGDGGPSPQPGAAPPGLKSGQLVYEDPALQGGRRVLRQMPNGTTAPIEGTGQSHKYRMPDGTEVFFNPHLKAPAQSDAIDPTLRGDELLKSLDPGEAAQVQGVLDGRIPLPSLSARMAPEAKRLRQLAFQTDPSFDSTVFAARAATQKDMSDGKLAVQRTAADKLIAHMGELHEVSAELNNSSTPLFNKLGNLIAANRGDPRIAKFEATKHLVSEEASKFFSGTGGATVSGIEEMSKLINSAQSPQQLQGVMTQLGKLMNGQIDAMAEQYNRGMRYTGDRAIKGESLLSKSAQDALAHIRENPLGGKPAGAAANLKQLYGLE